MPAGDSMPDTYIAIMLQSLKKKEQVLDEIIRLDDRQKDTLTDPECPFDVFDENEIIIYHIIFPTPNGISFSSSIHQGKDKFVPASGGALYKKRKEAELSGIIEATKILNNKLEQLEKDKNLTNEIL